LPKPNSTSENNGERRIFFLQSSGDLHKSGITNKLNIYKLGGQKYFNNILKKY